MDVLSFICSFIGGIDAWLWSWPLIILLFGTHIYMTIRTKFIQRKLFTAIKLSVTKDDNSDGNISNFASLATTLSACIGTGNIVGVSTAIILGGPGAVLWIWVIGVLGMATKYAETFIAVKYRVKEKDGGMLGGAMIAAERGFKRKRLGKIIGVSFAVFTVFSTFGIGSSVQSNSICGIINDYFPAVPEWLMGIVIVVLVGVVILGGIKSVSNVCTKIVPIMAIVYIVACIIIIVMNGAYLLPALKWVIQCAFTPVAMVGGGVGYGVMQALRYGSSRGLFSNESGMGSAPLAAANAATKNASRQGLVIMSGVFWDTLVICILTALMLLTTILASPELSAIFQVTNDIAVGGATPKDAALIAENCGYPTGFEKGLQLATIAFAQIPYFGPFILIFGIIMFAYSTFIGWSWYGDRVVTYLFGKKAIKFYRIAFLLFAFLGAVWGSAEWATCIWDFSDITNGLMTIPNVIAILALSKVIVKDTNYYVYNNNLDQIDPAPIPVWDKNGQQN